MTVKNWYNFSKNRDLKIVKLCRIAGVSLMFFFSVLAWTFPLIHSLSRLMQRCSPMCFKSSDKKKKQYVNEERERVKVTQADMNNIKRLS